MSEPLPPLVRSPGFIGKQRSDPRIIAIAKVPGISRGLYRAVKLAGPMQTVARGLGKWKAGRLQGLLSLEAKLPGKEMITQRLLLISPVRCELGEDFPLQEFSDLSDRSGVCRELRPAGLGNDQPGQLADKVVVRRRAERFIAPRVPAMRREDARP